MILHSNTRKQYMTNITWSTIEAIVFQTLLLCHHSLLFKVTDTYFYGLMGSLFGFIYCAVKIFDLGFNKSLLSFYKHYTADKNIFNYFIREQLKPNLIFYCISILGLFFVKLFLPTHIPFLSSFNFPLLIIASGLIATESIKIILKRFLQLAHNFRLVAACEISFIICYQCIIWSYYWWGYPLTHLFIFGSCFILSLGETVGLFFLTYYWYKNLPSQSNTLPLPAKHIAKNRLYMYGHSMIKQLFSANILVPLFAYSFGFEYAALLKLASYMTHSVTSIIEKIIDPSSTVLFAHTKTKSYTQAEENFILASRTAHHIIIGIFIFILINASKFLAFSQLTTTITPYIVLYFLINYGENFFITIEKLYIAQNRSEYIFLSTLITGIAGIGIFFYMPSPVSALLLLLLSRVVAFFALLIPLTYKWNIKPAMQLSPRYLFGSLIISFIFFFAF